MDKVGLEIFNFILQYLYELLYTNITVNLDM